MRAFERSGEAGFTLVEVLVALAIFSIGILALFHLRGESVRSVSLLEERALAQIVGENRVIETLHLGLPLVLGTSEGMTEMARRDWKWNENVAETTDANLRQISVSVRAPDSEDVLAELTAFREADR